MPLHMGKSKKAFSENVETEMHHGKPLKQSLAIAYAMKKKSRHHEDHKAHGGEMHKMDDGMCGAHGKYGCEMCHGGEYAKGGHVKRDHKVKGVHQVGEYLNDGPGQSRAGAMHEMDKKESMESIKDDHRNVLHDMKNMKKPNLYADGGFVHEEEASGYEPMPEEHHDMHYAHEEENQDFPHEEHDLVSRAMKARHYSHGGRVANKTEIEADFEPNEFDDLVKDDHLEDHHEHDHEGDEHGDHQEDEDRHDIVSRIMKSRRKKDRYPHTGMKGYPGYMD